MVKMEVTHEQIPAINKKWLNEESPILFLFLASGYKTKMNWVEIALLPLSTSAQSVTDCTDSDSLPIPTKIEKNEHLKEETLI